ncbi:cytochrome c oxidase assembly protein [Nocardioides sp.]|uniref:cytochrome c oxidase assembly protein n=1 Tax=Nocardioides sp. TaxID=35761 RepID=UPI002BE0F010|nr:cytochrome c oxidase assembly protein [Nocardioides sp.]HVX55752.1 cytochrome c oxidase assembly protein [Nocardioides sp.]
MPGMPGMDTMSNLSPLTWASFFGTWRLEAGWLEAGVLILGAYLIARRSARSSTVRPWRVACFTTGIVLMWVCVASAIGAYAMAVFWMHMVLHLALIMVVPALLVLGHPLTVLVEAFQGPAQERVRRVLRSWPVSALTHQATGALLYSIVIIGTHLTGFMDQMARHGWLMTGEQVLYIVAGYLFLQPLLGEEPIRANPPYLLRLMIVVAAMIPDTIVGIVLLQTDTVPFPVMMSMHPSWAPDPISDIHAAGGLMWAAGDGLMMAIGIGIMLGLISSPTKRDRMIGSWLEGARRAALTEHTGSATAIEDADSDEALEAYNRMLARLHEQGR